MSNTDFNGQASSAVVPTPPRLTGDYASDQIVLSDYLWDFYTGLLTPQASIDPNNLPDASSATIASAQLVANLAYQFCMSINNALATAGIAGFPLTPPTS